MRPTCAIAFVAVVGVWVCVCAGMAQSLLAQPQPNPNPTPDGADSAAAAAEQILAALRQQDLTALRQLIPPGEREQFDFDGKLMLESLRVTEYQVTTVKEHAESASATAAYTWKATFDAQHYGEKFAAAQRAKMTAAGLNDEQIVKQLSALREQLAPFLTRCRDHFKREKHVMSLVRQNNRWFLRGLTQPIGAHDNDGGETPALATRQVLQALKDSNFEALRRMVPHATRASFDRTGAALTAAIVVHSFEVGEPRIDGIRAWVGFSWRASLNVDQLVEAVVADRRKQLIDQGQTYEAAEKTVNEWRPHLVRTYEKLRTHFQRRDHTMTLVQVGGLWYLDELLEPPGDDE